MVTNIRYILLTALRDWLFAALMIGIIICALIAHMLGSTAIVETQEMILAYTTASARIVIMTGLIVFTCFHVRNAFDTKEIDVFLSRPITRANLIISYWLGFATVAFLLVLPTVGLIAVQGLLNKPGFLFWSGSLLVECWLVITVSLLAAFMLKSVVTSIIVSMGFYVVARMMGFFIALAEPSSPTGQPAISSGLQGLLKAISALMPRLDFLARSEWLIYGLKNPEDLKRITFHIVLFAVAILILTVIGFRRKQF